MEIEVLEGVFDANEIIARENRALLDENGTFMVNLMASPGAGKTSFIMRTLEGVKGSLKSAVIEGDIAGKVDSEKIAATGVAAIQINTGGSCHLEAKQVNRALIRLDLEGVDLVIVENVGNLVCPAEFKLGGADQVAHVLHYHQVDAFQVQPDQRAIDLLRLQVTGPARVYLDGRDPGGRYLL